MVLEFVQIEIHCVIMINFHNNSNNNDSKNGHHNHYLSLCFMHHGKAINFVYGAEACQHPKVGQCLIKPTTLRVCLAVRT